MGASESCLPVLKSFLDGYDAKKDLRKDAQYRADYIKCRNALNPNVKNKLFPKNFEYKKYNLFSVLVIFTKFELADHCVDLYDDVLKAVYSTYHQKLMSPTKSWPSDVEDEALQEQCLDQAEILAKMHRTHRDVRKFLITLLEEVKDLPKPMEFTSLSYLDVCIEFGLCELTVQILRKFPDSYRVQYTLKEIVQAISFCEDEEKRSEFTDTLEFFLISPKDRDPLDMYKDLVILLVRCRLGLQYAEWVFDKVKALGTMQKYLCDLVTDVSLEPRQEEALHEVLGVFLDRIQAEEPDAELENFLKSLLSVGETQDKDEEASVNTVGSSETAETMTSGVLVDNVNPEDNMGQSIKQQDDGCCVS